MGRKLPRVTEEAEQIGPPELPAFPWENQNKAIAIQLQS